MPREKESFAAILFDSQSVDDELTPSQGATQRSNVASSRDYSRSKSSFAQRAVELAASARACETELAPSFDPGPSRATTGERIVDEGSLVLWAPETAKRAGATTMSIPSSQLSQLSSRHVQMIRFLHEQFVRTDLSGGCAVRDEAEAEPIVGACAFCGAVASRSAKYRAVLVLCAPNAIMAWVETLKRFGVREVESARSSSQAELAFERVATGKSVACVLSHDVYRNVVEKAVAVPWIVCVYDEVHRLKSEKTKAYEAAQSLDKKVFRIGLSDQLFSNCSSLELWSCLNWVAPWRLGDRSLYETYFVKAINDGHNGVHTDLATQRTRELHAHLSTFLTPGIGQAALFQQYVPNIVGTRDDPTTAKKALEALAKFENVTIEEMAETILAMDKKARDALRCRVIASESGPFGEVLERWQRENNISS